MDFQVPNHYKHRATNFRKPLYVTGEVFFFVWLILGALLSLTLSYEH